MLLTRLRKDTAGATMVEFAIVISLLLLVVGGLFDFTFAYWQWNMAVKAVERAARIAAVSDPVAGGAAAWAKMNTITTIAGDPYPAGSFDCVCTTSGCTAGPAGPCPLAFNAAALNTIVYGRGNGAACNRAAPNVYAIGMCNLSNFITPAKVSIEYSATGIGFQGKPCGPIPTITVQLQNVQFGYFFLRGLMNLANATFPPVKTTITGEDLSFNFPNPNC